MAHEWLSSGYRMATFSSGRRFSSQSAFDQRSRRSARSATLSRPIPYIICSSVIGGASIPTPDSSRRAKRKDIDFDDDLRDEPAAEWANSIDQVVVPGCLITTEVVFFHRQSGTVLFTDLIQQFPSNWFSGWRSTVARLDLMTESEPAVPRKFRFMFRERRAARSAPAGGPPN